MGTTTRPHCRRCSRPAVGVVSVGELDEGQATTTVAEIPLCTEHLADIAAACGFERPHDLREVA